jgi:glutamate--cysteine ligase catalytic subunit
MKNAQLRDALNTQKFWFRRQVFDEYGNPCDCQPSSSIVSRSKLSTVPLYGSIDFPGSFMPHKEHSPIDDFDQEPFELMTIKEIINGKKATEDTEASPGLLDAVHAYLDGITIDVETRVNLECYLDFIRKRASGEYITTASWMRKFIRSHPDYKFDSILSETINYDLLNTIQKISKAEYFPEEMYGPKMQQFMSQR